ncbi:hypothetical protein ACQB60_34430 [Actinomycetota bacterium Odt1-20B]
MKRILTASAAVALLVTGTAACTFGGREASSTECKSGTYTWSDVQRKDTLTGLAKPIRFKKKASHYVADIKPLPRGHHQVTFTAETSGPEAKGALKSLGRQLKLDGKLASLGEEVGHSAVGFEDESDSTLKGAYYAWSSADIVKAEFSYRCNGAQPVHGSVLTWESSGTGFLPCTDRQEEDEEADKAALTAARERCPQGSPAAEAPQEELGTA